MTSYTTVPTAWNEDDGEAISAIASIAEAYDTDPQACLERSLGDWITWIEEQGHRSECVTALLKAVLELEGVSGAAASDVLASLTPEISLQDAMVRLHNASPLFLNALFNHLDQAVELQANMLLVAGGVGKQKQGVPRQRQTALAPHPGLDRRALKEIGAGKAAKKAASTPLDKNASEIDAIGIGGISPGASKEAARDTGSGLPDREKARSQDRAPAFGQGDQSIVRDKPQDTIPEPQASKARDQQQVGTQPREEAIQAIIEAVTQASVRAPRPSGDRESSTTPALNWDRFQQDLMGDKLKSVHPLYLNWMAQILNRQPQRP